jgi:lipoyl-dependent peroxiredoxin
MKKNKAQAIWKGSLKEGNGVIKLDSNKQEIAYDFGTRFAEKPGSNPEELIAAAHAGCFSQALSNILTEKGYTPKKITTTAEVHLEKTDNGFKISESHLSTEVEVDDIEEALFLKLAVEAKVNCPVSLAISSVKINMKAKLIQ